MESSSAKCTSKISRGAWAVAGCGLYYIACSKHLAWGYVDQPPLIALVVLYGLPPAISGHQNYFLWGPREYTGESVIVLDGEQRDLDRRFTSVEKVAHVEHPYSMPYEHFDVFYCRAPGNLLRKSGHM